MEMKYRIQGRLMFYNTYIYAHIQLTTAHSGTSVLATEAAERDRGQLLPGSDNLGRLTNLGPLGIRDHPRSLRS